MSWKLLLDILTLAVVLVFVAPLAQYNDEVLKSDYFTWKRHPKKIYTRFFKCLSFGSIKLCRSSSLRNSIAVYELWFFQKNCRKEIRWICHENYISNHSLRRQNIYFFFTFIYIIVYLRIKYIYINKIMQK